MWNLSNLTPPPNFTYKSTNVDVATLKKACLKAVAVLQDQKQLHSEAALLSRFLYSMKTKFRSDKAFDILGKVNRSLSEYLSMNLHAAYVNFSECVPDPSDPDQYVPSRQMLQYVLVKTQSFGRLWRYITTHCEVAAQYLRARMGLGHNWWAAVVALAITSRIWAFGKYLAICACEWFSQLKPFLEILKVNGPPWLPTNYCFPENLHHWLAVNMQEKESISQKCARVTATSIDKLFTVSCERYIDGDDDVEIVDDSSPAENVEECFQQFENIPTENLGHVSEKEPVNPLKEDIGGLSEKEPVNPFKEDLGELVTRDTVIVINSKNSAQSSARDNDMLKLIPSNNQPSSEYTLDNDSISEQSNSIIKSLNNTKGVDPEVLHIAPPMAITEKSRNIKHTSNISSSSLTNESSVQMRVKTHITQLKTHFDLISFLQVEETLRNQSKKSCITHNLDKLQWNILKNLISSYVTKLKKKHASKNEKKYERLMKKARKAIAVSLK